MTLKHGICIFELAPNTLQAFHFYIKSSTNIMSCVPSIGKTQTDVGLFFDNWLHLIALSKWLRIVCLQNTRMVGDGVLLFSANR